MPVPSVADSCWLRLADGKVAGFETSHVALKFLIKRVRSDAVPAPAKSRELHEFFTKYERLLAKEISYLKR